MKYILFDIDGVIFSEEKCFDVSAILLDTYLREDKYLAIESLKFSLDRKEDIKKLRSFYYLEDEILSYFKEKSLNSNVDMVYIYILATILYLNREYKLELDFATENTIGSILNKIKANSSQEIIFEPCKILSFFKDNFKQGTKEAFIEEVLILFSREFRINKALLEINGDIYKAFDDEFANLYIAYDKFYNGDETIVDIEDLKEFFRYLKERGYTLGIGTGRPLADVILPLQKLGLYQYFNKKHIATYDDVLLASILSGEKHLDKPHPFTFRCGHYGNNPEHYEAYLRKNDLYKILHKEDIVYVVGDSISDMLAAKGNNYIAIATLNGIDKDKGKQKLLESGADYIIENVLDLKWIID